MKKTNLLIASAVAAVLTIPLVSAAQSGPAPKPKFEAEKCFGIAKAGKNDCQTANSSCAGTSKRDNQGDAWIYIPAGSCDKVVGGSKEPKKA
ncbi:MAG: signal peptidase [Candidatus Rokuibacteriota bacterium]|nr:MAG: signal peptidase [Candidatus Rokubacteria bacterium]